MQATCLRLRQRKVEPVSAECGPCLNFDLGGRSFASGFETPTADATLDWTPVEASFWMDPTSFRMRHLVGITLAAVLTAAALRHIIHVYAGISREEIRTMALITAGAGILLAIILFRRRKRQP